MKHKKDIKDYVIKDHLDMRLKEVSFPIREYMPVPTANNIVYIGEQAYTIEWTELRENNMSLFLRVCSDDILFFK